MSVDKKHSILITKSQRNLVLKLINTASPAQRRHINQFHLLREKIKDCVLCEDDLLPNNYVGIETVFDLEMPFGIVKGLQLVLPEHANPKIHKISILSPMGIAIFGNKQGDLIEFNLFHETERAQLIQVGIPKRRKKAQKLKKSFGRKRV